MIKRIESGIAGKGLGYDYLSNIKGLATKLELRGVVFTKNDGSIKVVAEGENENLIKFTKKLERNFFFSPIENFYAIWHDSTGEFKDFSIINNK
ncbi:MAG: acylphosphatase [Candidatus Nomurabacteria bacterium]|nr:acylphosphatase [Candidatus Nomurabacteria bacterium]